MKVCLQKDEWYPAYYIDDLWSTGDSYLIPDAQVAWIRETFSQFSKAQEYLADIYRRGPIDT